jgi:hypothetical protein
MNCQKCPIFIATERDDESLRQKTAIEMANLYADILETFGIDSLTPEDINCLGCRSEIGRFFGCERCSIRQCCREKSLVTCANCQEYESCDTLKGFCSFEAHRPAKKNLDKIRSRL